MSLTLGSAEADAVIDRFDRVERTVHWATATLFFFLMATGAALYAGPISTVVGHRDVVRNVHVLAGLALPVPMLTSLIGRWGRALRRDLRRLSRWSSDDRAWLRPRARPSAKLGKFNPGQKLNAVFLGAAAIVMMATGVVLKWFSLFSLGTRTGATFVHDWFALGIWLAVGGHIFFAMRDPIALAGMLRGSVTARWARTRRPRWYEEETGRPASRLKESSTAAVQPGR
jgi:formate dehydrogenase subunit gamma